MDIDDIQQVAVLGSGSMGHGITEVVALAGYDVVMRDIDEEIVQDGYDNIAWSVEKLAEKGIVSEDPEEVLSRVRTTTSVEEAVSDADLVVEAAPEKMALKKDIFTELDELAPADAILASNTSSLSITEMASVTSRPDQVVGLHFFNPPVKMELVEVIYGEETSDETAETAHAFVEAIGKTPIYVRKDVRGFVVNTVLGPFMSEPAWMVSADEATIEQADASLVHERGYPMGPFELGDLTGIDIGYHIREEAGDPIPPIMAEKVEGGDLGQKTGTGYYEYDEGEGPTYEPEDASGFDWLRVEALIVNEAAWLVREGVATPEAIDLGTRLGLGFPEGPCTRGDELGLDTVVEKLRELHEEYGDDRYVPDDYLVEKAEAGDTGKDAGAGFYDYGDAGARDYQFIEWELDDRGVLAVTLDRPERLNALSDGLMDEVVHLLDTVDTDEVLCLTFEGTGDQAFSAGADITGFDALAPTDAMDVSDFFERVAEFPRPTLAKIQGFCLGGGHELALACDLRIATEDSQFGFPEINLGLIPGGGGTQRAMRMLTECRAKELVFRGHRIDGETAEEWGLINRAVDADEFDDVCAEFITDIVEGPPIALEVAKSVMDKGANASLDAGLKMEGQGFGLLLSTEDAREGTHAFLEKREANFEGK